MLNARAQIVLLAAVTLVMSLLGVSPGVPDVPAEASAGAPRNVAVPGPVEPVSLAPSAGQFVALQPFAVSVGTIATGGTKSVPVAGVGGVAPAGQVSAIAVVLNGRATTTTGAVTAFEEGTSRPSDTSLRIGTHGQSSSYDVIPVSSTGKVSIYASQAATVGMHVRGYYTSDQATTAGSTFVSTSRTMVLNEARTGGSNKNVTLSGISGIPAAASVEAVALEVTAQSAAAAGSVDVYQYGAANPPGASLWVPAAGSPRSAFETAQLSAGGSITVYTSVNATITVRLRGYYLAADATTALGTRYRPVRPATAISGVSLAAGGTEAAVLAGQYGVPAASTVGNVAVHAAALSPGANGLYTLYASGSTRSTDRSLMYTDGVHDQAYDLVPLSPGGSTTLYSSQAATAWMRVVGYTLKATVPGAPGNVFAAAGDGTAQLNWTKPADDGGAAITGYRISQEPGGTSYTVGNTTSAQITGLENGTRYVFNVRAINAVGVSPESAPTQPETPNPPPGPSRPFITDVLPRDSGAEVRWVPPSTGSASITGYRLEASPGGTTWNVASDATSTKVTGLSNGESYTFKLYAINGNGETVSPTSRTVVPKAAEVPMSAPITAVVPGDGSLTVQWVEPLDGGSAITGYEITANPGAHTQQVSAEVGVTTLGGLTNGTSYSVSVRAINSAGKGAVRTENDIVPRASRAPSEPRDITASAQATGKVALTWQPPADPGSSAVSEYRVQVSPTGGQIAVSGTTATVTSLDSTTAYTFAVQAINAAGASPASTPTKPIMPDYAAKKPVVVLTAASADRLREIHRDGAMDFVSPTDQVKGLAVGDLVMVPPSPAAPDSYFGKVTSAESVSGLFVVETERGHLTDAVSRGGFTATETLDSSDDTQFSPAVAGVKLVEPKGPGKSATSSAIQNGVTLEGGKLVATVEQTFGTNAELTIAGSITIDPQADFGLRFDGIVPAGMSAELAVDYQADLTGTLFGGIQEQQLLDIRLGGIKKRVKGSIGPVPVWAMVTSDLYVRASFTAGAGVTFTAFIKRRVGADLDQKGSDATAESTADSGDEDGVKVEAFGSASLQAGLVSETKVELYDLFGPQLDASFMLVGTADILADPWASLKLTAEGVIKFTPESIGGIPIDFSQELFSWEKTLWDSGGPFKGLLVTPNFAHTNNGLEARFRADATPSGSPTIRWRVVEGPGAVGDSDGRFVSQASGQSVVEAYDPSGDYQSGRGTVLTGDYLPGLPARPTVRPEPFSLRVLWNPPTNSGPQVITGYVLRAIEAGSNGKRVYTKETGGGITEAVIPDLKPGVDYWVSVAAMNANGLGGFSDGALARPTEDLIRAGSATNVAVDSSGAPDRDSSSTHWGAAVSGNGQYVLFSVKGTSNLAPAEIQGSSSIYLVRRDLSSGELILVSRASDGVTPEPVSVNCYAHTCGGKTSFAINYDGDSIAYALDRATIGGVSKVRVQNILSGPAWEVDAPRTGLSADLVGIFLSDDARTVLFRSPYQVGQGWNYHLYRAQAPASAATRVDICKPDSLDCSGYSASSDGTRVAYVDGGDLLRFDAVSGQTLRVIEHSQVSDGSSSPTISGDGAQIAVDVWNGSRNELLLVDADSGSRQVVNAGDVYFPFALDQSGDRLVYMRGRIVGGGPYYDSFYNVFDLRESVPIGGSAGHPLGSASLSRSGSVFVSTRWECLPDCDMQTGVFVQRFFVTRS